MRADYIRKCCTRKLYAELVGVSVVSSTVRSVRIFNSILCKGKHKFCTYVVYRCPWVAPGPHFLDSKADGLYHRSVKHNGVLAITARKQRYANPGRVCQQVHRYCAKNHYYGKK